MAGHETFMLGPLGYMLDLPSPSARAGVNAPQNRYGGVFESATGKKTVDVLGSRRKWEFNWVNLAKNQDSLLRAFWLQTAMQSLRFIDPFADNLLTPDASSGGSTSKTSDSFTKTAGTSLGPIAITTPVLADILVPFISHAQQWVMPASTVGQLWADDNAYFRIPIRDTRPLYLKWLATGSGTVHAAVKPYNKAGSSLTVQTGSGVALDATWKAITYTYTPTASSHYSFSAGLTLDSSAGIKTILLTAGQVNDVSGVDWSLGEGVGPVIITSYDPTYSHYTRKYTTKFIVEEG